MNIDTAAISKYIDTASVIACLEVAFAVFDGVTSPPRDEERFPTPPSNRLAFALALLASIVPALVIVIALIALEDESNPRPFWALFIFGVGTMWMAYRVNIGALCAGEKA